MLTMSEMGQTRLTVATADSLSTFMSTLSASYTKLVQGGVFAPSETRPSSLVSIALERDGGIVCPLIYSYVNDVPSMLDVPFLNVICDMLDGLFNLAEDVARRLNLVRACGSYVRKYSINPRRFFSVTYFTQVISLHLTTQVRRERFLESICASVRRFLVWLRGGLRQLEARHCVDPMRAIHLAPHAASLVEIADRKLGLVVLKAGPREGSVAFNIRPHANQAWGHIRALCEATDPMGYVALPSNYASAFHRTDRNNETVDSDSERFLRHIVPGPEKGMYRLESTPKAPLLRGQ